MLRLWRLHRAHGHLPDAGGALDQPAALMEALDVMNATADAIIAERKGRR